jgi:hypothetical protein
MCEQSHVTAGFVFSAPGKCFRSADVLLSEDIRVGSVQLCYLLLAGVSFQA